MDVDKRYQVFVSSTFEDLIEERREVTQALLELDCFPSGMELFPAADNDQWTLIKKVISECDYYILITAGRYGSVGPEGYSYTEMEYRYALEANKPIIAFIHKGIDTLPMHKNEDSHEARAKLTSFHALAKRKMVKFWSSPAELGSIVSRSLIKLIRTNPSDGWVRGGKITDASAYREIAELRRLLNETLQSKKEDEAQVTERENLLKGDDLLDLPCTLETISKESLSTEIFEWTADVSVNHLFAALAPSLMNDPTEGTLKRKASEYLRRLEWDEIEKDSEDKGSIFHDFYIDDESLETAIIQFLALGLIKKQKHQKGFVYTLTPLGEKEMYKLRALRRAAE